MSINRYRSSSSAVLGGFAAILMIPAVFVVSDRLWLEAGHEAEEMLETAVYPTGVGDEDIFRGRVNVFEPVLGFRGRSFYLRAFNPVTRIDSRMEKTGLDDTGRYALYEWTVNPGEKSGDGKRVYYLKSGEHRYFRVGTRRYFP